LTLAALGALGALGAFGAFGAFGALGARFRGFDNYGVVKELIDRRADVNAKIVEEERSCLRQHEMMIYILLEYSRKRSNPDL
jgi:hypothetical protein